VSVTAVAPAHRAEFAFPVEVGVGERP
jgi:hypothetical protein